MIDMPLAYRDWTRNAACREEDPETFFSPDGERGIVRRRREREAKAICRPCPARAECLAYALTTETTSGRHGVYGGLTAEERAALTKGGAE